MQTSINESSLIFNALNKINVLAVYSRRVQKHLTSIISAAFSKGYRGKTVDFAEFSNCHRTTLGHFLNKGCWDDEKLSTVIHKTVVQTVYDEAERTGKPVYCIIDDTISSKTKPSSQAAHPMESASFHMSHLKHRQDYGHQAVAVMLSCNQITLNYAIIMYDKTQSKIDLVCDVARQLPIVPGLGYLLCDSWYTCNKVMNSFIQKGFYTIGALKTNRVIYPCGIREKLSCYAERMEKSDPGVRLVTVDSRQYYVFRYEGSLNGLDNAVVILSYPKDAFGQKKALRAFLCTNIDLSTEQILNIYTDRWPIEVFFRDTKGKLALNQYQIRSAKGIRRFWLLMSLAHLLCCIGTGRTLPFSQGYSLWRKQILKERILFIYDCGRNHIDFSYLLGAIC